MASGQFLPARVLSCESPVSRLPSLQFISRLPSLQFISRLQSLQFISRLQSPFSRLNMHFLLFYDVSPDYLERRAEFRLAHLNKAWASHEAGGLVLGGALADPVDQAVLLFKGESSRVAEAFAESDPYVLNGLVKRWHVRQWNTVAGSDAANPIRP